jgi:hypothetical protein
MTAPTCYVMLCWPRSGGTLLNRLLVAHPDLWVLSEVNPNGCGGGSVVGVRAQAREWFDQEVTTEDFGAGVAELAEAAAAAGRTLIVRDWTFADFGGSAVASHRFSTLEALARVDLPVVPFAFVRDAIDVWLSQRLPLETFAPAYAAFAERLRSRGLPVFHYEDLCETPERFEARLCGFLGLRRREGSGDLGSRERVNGDVQLGRASRGFGLNAPARLSRKPASADEIEALEACDALRRANEALGYAHRYGDTRRETAAERVLRRIRNRLTA